MQAHTNIVDWGRELGGSFQNEDKLSKHYLNVYGAAFHLIVAQSLAALLVLLPLVHPLHDDSS